MNVSLIHFISKITMKHFLYLKQSNSYTASFKSGTNSQVAFSSPFFPLTNFALL